MSEQVNFLPDKLWLMLKKLLQDTDLDRVTVKNLCTEAKIHRATFYRYFSDILALLEYGLKKSYQTVSIILLMIRVRCPVSNHFLSHAMT